MSESRPDVGCAAVRVGGRCERGGGKAGGSAGQGDSREGQGEREEGGRGGSRGGEPTVGAAPEQGTLRNLFPLAHSWLRLSRYRGCLCFCPRGLGICCAMSGSDGGCAADSRQREKETGRSKSCERLRSCSLCMCYAMSGNGVGCAVIKGCMLVPMHVLRGVR